MAKLKSVAFICIGVAVCYMFLTAFMPVITEVVEISSANISANPNLDQYVGAKEGLDIMPWLLYLLPGAIGMIALVIVLRRP